MLTLPNKVSAGQPVRAQTLNQLIDYVRAITPRPSSSLTWDVRPGGATAEVIDRPKRGTTSIAVSPIAPLTLTTTPPSGWVAPETDQTDPDNVPYRFWLTFGTVDYSTPERVDAQSPFIAPVCEIPRNVSQTTTRRVHLECEWSGPINQYPLWTHVWLKEEAYTSSTPALTADPIDAATGWRLKFRLLLGYCYVSVTGTGAAQTKTPVANNTDQGSFRSVIQGTNGYVQFTAADIPDHPPKVMMAREVVFFRNRRSTA
ncbi:hypothetical protein [Geminisphaera colitermitum]|uniref:hypothetical protein n=1 Tax=Geminisphaera colitermitum TaxID=1148786 RepID=UPI00019654DF|nr:hypothetical protein [Geminisphaera colitermitum]